MGDIFGTTKTELKPTDVIHYTQYNTLKRFNSIDCLALSPDDGRVFSSTKGETVLVHDIQRYFLFYRPSHSLLPIFKTNFKNSYNFCLNRSQLLHVIRQYDNVRGISVQPSSYKGDVFAAGDDDGVLYIFDIRCSTTDT